MNLFLKKKPSKQISINTRGRLKNKNKKREALRQQSSLTKIIEDIKAEWRIIRGEAFNKTPENFIIK